MRLLDLSCSIHLNALLHSELDTSFRRERSLAMVVVSLLLWLYREETPSMIFHRTPMAKLLAELVKTCRTPEQRVLTTQQLFARVLAVLKIEVDLATTAGSDLPGKVRRALVSLS